MLQWFIVWLGQTIFWSKVSFLEGVLILSLTYCYPKYDVLATRILCTYKGNQTVVRNSTLNVEQWNMASLLPTEQISAKLSKHVGFTLELIQSWAPVNLLSICQGLLPHMGHETTQGEVGEHLPKPHIIPIIIYSSEKAEIRENHRSYQLIPAHDHCCHPLHTVTISHLQLGYISRGKNDLKPYWVSQVASEIWFIKG